MTYEQRQVAKFMDLFKQKVQPSPVLPDAETRALRAKLIFEEAVETINALGFSLVNPHAPMELEGSVELVSNLKPNLVGIVDGIADSHYVGYCGTGLACGVDMEEVFAEVHRSNMTKQWKESEIELARKKYPGCVIENYGAGLYRVLVGGKIIKSPSYEPARVKEILDAQILAGSR